MSRVKKIFSSFIELYLKATMKKIKENSGI